MNTNIRKCFSATVEAARDLVMSPLRKYVLYSVVLHVALVGAFSVTMFLPKAAEPAKPAVAAPAKAEQATTTTTLAASAKPTGKGEDYYKREGIDTRPATRDEIPKNPFESKDTQGKSLEDLK